MPPDASTQPDRPTVFVSYSHKDEGWKDRLVQQLRVLEPEGVLEVWEDRRLAAGSDWFPEIKQAMGRAVAAVLLISADFLTSEFILGQEVPCLLERRKAEGLLVIPLIVRPCDWRGVTWLAKINCRPKDGRPLAAVRKARADQDLAALVAEIRGLLEESGKRIPSPWEGGGWDRGEVRRGAVPLTEEASVEVAATPLLASPLPQPPPPRGEETPAPHLDIGRLPTSGPLFVGREAELARLDAAWEDASTHVLTFVAFGGVGKSTLVGRWLDGMAADGWRGARRVLDWSFYSQGTEERVTSADRFLDSALHFFGDPDPKAGAPRDRGLRLAELVRREKTLLVLDGVEPLQHPPGPLGGRLKDPGLAAFLKSLAGSNPGLCVVTTRERIADLESSPRTAPQVDLATLSPDAGVELLRQLGVKGKDFELRAASGEFGGHALALALLGTYLRDVCKGDVRRRREVPLLDEDADEDGHARRVITSYAAWLPGPELEVLRLLGFFDRAATTELVAALRAEPSISGLTEHIGPQQETRFQKAVARLGRARLLGKAEKPGTLDAHPLVRVYFQEELERERPQAWQEGNLRLYEYLKRAAPKFPETLEAMEPLYAAVVHGCRAGRQQEAMDEVFYRRIRRGRKVFSWHKLGAFGSELAALAGFFDRLWDQPSTGLTAADQGFVLNSAAFCLRVLGRLAEAVQPMQAGLERYIALEKWEDAARSAGNLSELTIILGEMKRAVTFGEQSVALAERSGNAFQRMSKRTTLADALHQVGRGEESATAFREAEAMQAEWHPQYPLLNSLQGYRYCDLLLSRSEPEEGGGLDGLVSTPGKTRRLRQGYREVQKRAEQTLKWAIQDLSWGPPDIALDHLSLGRAQLCLALTASGLATPAEADFAQAAEHLDRAVEKLRQAAREDYLPFGLLARAALHRLRGNRSGAAADLSEALEIAERGGMRLHACDAHLECARLDLQQDDIAAARKHVAAARRLVNETGYKRREREVAWLERRLDRRE
jgi:tetratricopeptide (TPR) repeat protein